ncbi:chorismate-binding protein [Micrococcus luteus]
MQTGPTAVPGARFDDLAAGTVLEFDSFSETILASRSEDVLPALRRVQRAVDGGRWAAGYVAYEAALGLDPRFHCHEPAPGRPLVWFGLADAPVTAPADLPAGDAVDLDWQAQWTPEQHAERLARVHAAIARGDTYQCNLTTRLTAPLTAGLGSDAGARRRWYAHLARRQQGSFHAHLETGGLSVLSASPELFLRHEGGVLTVRPMKGTAARSADPESDRAARARLEASAKDRAENVMIVDLMRNDVARVSRTGSVAVTGLLTCEAYPTVWQLTSTVTGRTRPGTGLPELFAGLFPCGSITGAPKASTMDLITELEDSPRGVYCGAVGYLAPGARPRTVFSVAIRTVVADLAAGTAEYGVGGGITWSSTAADEHAELLAKARILTGRGAGAAGTPAAARVETAPVTVAGARERTVEG